MSTTKSPASAVTPTGHNKLDTQANMYYSSNFDDTTAERVLQVLLSIYNREKGTNYSVAVKRREHMEQSA